MNYKAIAFDLDDTLIDTTNELIPFACQKIHTYLSTLGHPGRYDEFDVLRKNFVKTKSHKEFFKSLIPTLINTKPDTLETLNRLFYEPDIPHNLKLMDGAEENLLHLSSKYDVYVVTAGVVSAQKRKLEQLKIDRFIKSENILIVTDGAFQTKKLAFEKILTDTKIIPAQLLSVGNRLSQEIRMAKQLGCRTCYFKYGEHAEDTAQDHFEFPDYIISSHKELISVCQL